MSPEAPLPQFCALAALQQHGVRPQLEASPPKLGALPDALDGALAA